MGKTELVNLYVEPSTKEEWTEYVDESDSATSVSHLIRKSVNRQIAGQYNPSGSTDASGSGTAELSDDIVTQLDRIEESIGDLTTRVRSIEETPDESEYELQRSILGILPTLPHPSEMDEFEKDDRGEWQAPEPVEYEQYGMTIGEIANETGSTKDDVSDAIDTLYETTNQVTGVISGQTGQRYIWRKH
jgi:hypothetical protein